jgi:signal transduction histidine kinase
MKRKWMFLAAAVSVASLLLAGPVLAGKKEDAKALVNQAVAMAEKQGVDAAVEAVKDKNGPFVKDDLYVFAGTTKKVELIAHPIKPVLVGKDMGKMKDVKGKYFFVEFMNTAKGPGEGWVEYWWAKPGEKKPSPKNTYVKRVPGEEVWFAAGYYK